MKKPITAICLCGSKFTVEPHMIHSERKICSSCYRREAHIILLTARAEKLKRERPYEVKNLTKLKEYHETKKKLTD